MSDRSFTVEQLTRLLGGEFEGKPDHIIKGVASLEDASFNEVSFLINKRYIESFRNTKAGAVLVPSDMKLDIPYNSFAIIKVKDIDMALLALAELFAPVRVKIASGIHRTAIVASDAVLEEGVCIGPYAVIEEGVRIGRNSVIGAGCYVGHFSVIGEDCLIYPNVSIRERTVIGNRVIIHSGAVIGSDGYGFLPRVENGKLSILKIPQIGRVVIGDDVEIGANVTIDRARFGETRIGKSVKIDNLVHIAHNVVIGDYTGIVAQVGISGSVRIGSRVIIWGQAGIAGHLKIGDDARIEAQSGVINDVENGQVVFGTPARQRQHAWRIEAILDRLPDIYRIVKNIEKQISFLEGRIKSLEEHLKEEKKE